MPAPLVCLEVGVNLLRRWWKRALLALGLLLGIGGIWLWNSVLWVFFVKPGEGGPHLHGRLQSTVGSPAGAPGFQDGQGDAVRMAKPIRLAALDARTVVFADINNHAIRTLDLDGKVRTLAGGPDLKGHRDGPAREARFTSPHGVAVRPDGVIAVSEASNHTVRLLTPKGDTFEVSTLAGRPGASGGQDGPCAEARFSSPHAVLWGPEGELYVADIGNASVRKVHQGRVTTVAGTGSRGAQDGLQGTLSWPMDLALDAEGGLWIADCGTLTLRTWNPRQGLGTPFPGLRLAMPHGVTLLPDGRVGVAEMNGQRILIFDRQGRVSTLYGTTRKGLAQGEVNRPAALLVHAGRLWVADLGNHRILSLALPQ